VVLLQHHRTLTPPDLLLHCCNSWPQKSNLKPSVVLLQQPGRNPGMRMWFCSTTAYCNDATKHHAHQLMIPISPTTTGRPTHEPEDQQISTKTAKQAAINTAPSAATGSRQLQLVLDTHIPFLTGTAAHSASETGSRLGHQSLLLLLLPHRPCLQQPLLPLLLPAWHAAAADLH